jgi:tetratricopeptide (TPR) repeat protein
MNSSFNSDFSETNAQLLFSQGVDFFEHGNFSAASKCFEQALAVEPSNIDARLNLAISLINCHRLAAALVQLDQTLASDPVNGLAYFHKAFSLRELGQPQQALKCIHRAIELLGDNSSALTLRGQILSLTDAQSALEDFSKACEISPHEANLQFNLGCAYHRLGYDVQALEAFNRALELEPNFMQALCNKANTLRDLGLPHEALACYEQARQLSNDDSVVLWNLSLAFLQMGNWSEGWSLYEYRWPTAKSQAPAWPGKRLTGEDPVRDRSVLIIGEQGLGDMIQFARYVHLLAAQGAKIVLQVPGTLHLLFSRLPGVIQCIDLHQTAPECDFHCPIMSLALVFPTFTHNVPFHNQPYLSADPLKVDDWRNQLGTNTSRRIGLVVRGQSRNPREHLRSIGLAPLLAFLNTADQYVLLQDKIHEDDRLLLASHPQILDVSDKLQNFDDTAALCLLMDEIICIDTSVAHLAGALGKSTRLLLPLASDWRWLISRRDSPWYSNMKLYRQTSPGSWSEILDQVFTDL